MKELQISVSSRSRNYDGDNWEIIVKVQNGLQFSYEYLFFTNSRLTRMKCLKSDDNEYIGIATNAAKEHMNKLKTIADDNKFSFSKLLKEKIK